jgi:hypothetical protein
MELKLELVRDFVTRDGASRTRTRAARDEPHGLSRTSAMAIRAVGGIMVGLSLEPAWAVGGPDIAADLGKLVQRTTRASSVHA